MLGFFCYLCFQSSANVYVQSLNGASLTSTSQPELFGVHKLNPCKLLSLVRSELLDLTPAVQT